MGPDGAKMSKRHGATAVGEYRDMGYLPQALTNYLALLSWSPPEGREVLRLEELVKLFDIDDLSSSPAVFDPARLDWLNGRHLRGMSLEGLTEIARTYAPEWSRHPSFPLMVDSVLDNLTTLGELPEHLEVFGEAVEPDEKAAKWLQGDTANRVMDRAGRALESYEVKDLEDAREVIAGFKQDFLEKGLKPKEVLMPLRVALTGRDKGPALPYLIAVLGGEECIDRLKRSREIT
jgi:glutamyl/glutaminyl-tRNA synthetase